MGFLKSLFKAISAPKQKTEDRSFLTARGNTSDEDRIAELHRNATAYKDAKEWDKAIACLREAAALAPKVKTSYPIKHYLRLPLFLQQAGYFDESMREFENILQSVESRTAREFSHRPKRTQKMLANADYAAIYDSMSLACKRQKMPEQAGEYKEKAAQYKGKHAKMLEKDLASPINPRRRA